MAVFFFWGQVRSSRVITCFAIIIAVATGRVVDIVGRPSALRDFTLSDEVFAGAGQEGAGLGWLWRVRGDGSWVGL